MYWCLWEFNPVDGPLLENIPEQWLDARVEESPGLIFFEADFTTPIPMADPTEEDLSSPLFDAVWEAIKLWDIEREDNLGFSHATGTDVMTILNAIRNMDPQTLAYALPEMVAYWGCIKVGAHATTGEYSDQVVPELLFVDALKRWEKDK